MKTFMKRVRDFILADMTDKLVREHQKDRDLAYFVSLPDHTLRITHRGRVFTFFIPDADRDTVQRHILETRAFYELDILTRLRDQVSVKGRVVADIGANIGNHSMYFTGVAGARFCHSFEPNTYARSVLARNISDNNLEQSVKIHPFGIAAEAGEWSFNVVRGANIGSNSYKSGGDDGIQFLPLDRFEFDDLALLKIDVEGMGDQVLMGAETVIRKFQPAIFIELIGDEARRAMPILRDMGYRIADEMAGGNYLFRHHEHSETR